MWDLDRLLQIGGCSYLSLGGLLYGLAALKGQILGELQSIIIVKNFSDLRNFVGRSSTPVAVRGRVTSATPFKSEFADIQAVFSLLTEDEVSKLRRGADWETHKQLQKVVRREVPWSLKDHNGDAVVLQLSGQLDSYPVLSLAGTRSRPSGNSFLWRALESLGSSSVIGYEEKERILPLDTELTAIGQVISLGGKAAANLSQDPSVQAHQSASKPEVAICAPPKGQLRLSPISLEEQITSLEGWSRNLRRAAFACTISGSVLLGAYFARKGIKALKRWRQRKHEQKFRSSLAARRAAAAQAHGEEVAESSTAGDGAASTSSRTKWSCPVCFLEEGCVPCFFQCGHVVCEECINRGRMARCPVCRAASQPRKLYMT